MLVVPRVVSVKATECNVNTKFGLEEIDVVW